MTNRIATLAVILAVIPALSTTLHVPSGQATLQAGLNAAVPGDTVLVACGTYYEHDIIMADGVHLLSETGDSDCVTIDAERLGRGFICMNHEFVAQLEGFTVTGGYAEPGENYGGGFYCDSASPRIANCRFTANEADYRGGGLFLQYSEAEIVDCIFTDNLAGNGGGGGMGTQGSDFYLADCVFLDNEGIDAGGLWISHGTPTVLRCLFANNDAMFWGGGLVCSSEASALIRQCTFIGNDAYEGGGAWVNYHSSPIFENCILAFNQDGTGVWVNDNGNTPSFTCCDFYGNADGNFGGSVEDQTGLNGNISSHPLFCDQNEGDLTLSTGSPCLPENNDCGVLMGVYELGCENPTSIPGGEFAVEESTWSRVKALF